MVTILPGYDMGKSSVEVLELEMLQACLQLLSHFFVMPYQLLGIIYSSIGKLLSIMHSIRKVLKVIDASYMFYAYSAKLRKNFMCRCSPHLLHYLFTLFLVG